MQNYKPWGNNFKCRKLFTTQRLQNVWRQHHEHHARFTNFPAGSEEILQTEQWQQQQTKKEMFRCLHAAFVQLEIIPDAYFDLHLSFARIKNKSPKQQESVKRLILVILCSLSECAESYVWTSKCNAWKVEMLSFLLQIHAQFSSTKSSKKDKHSGKRRQVNILPVSPAGSLMWQVIFHSEM